jgi:hypothetical protein
VRGQTLVYPGCGNYHGRQLSNLFNTLGFAAGEELTDFGNEGITRIAEGELGEIWQVRAFAPANCTRCLP